MIIPAGQLAKTVSGDPSPQLIVYDVLMAVVLDSLVNLKLCCASPSQTLKVVRSPYVTTLTKGSAFPTAASGTLRTVTVLEIESMQKLELVTINFTWKVCDPLAPTAD